MLVKVPKKKLKIIIPIFFILLIILFIIVKNCGVVKYQIKRKLNIVFPNHFSAVVYYQDNVPIYDVENVDFDNHDVREVWTGKGRSHLTNHSRGFSLSFPDSAEFDFSTAQEYITVNCDEFRAVVSKEYSTYDPTMTSKFVEDYLHKYILSKRYMAVNRIEINRSEDIRINNFPVRILAITRHPDTETEIKNNTYVYCYLYTNSNMFYRIMFNANEYNDKLMEEVFNTLYSFNGDIPIRGISSTFTNFKPNIPKNWSKETKEFYDRLVNSKDFKWGAFLSGSVKCDNFEKIDELEEKIDYNLDGLLDYCYHTDDIPVDSMREAHKRGKIIELTVQTSMVMNNNLDGYTPVFDLLDGVYDHMIIKMAKELKSVEFPILFRFNNEMNSDWTNYSGSCLLDDPEIYVKLWRKFYDMFEKEGVNNLIWVFNPNNDSFPPCGYNSSLAYYPGDDYVQVFGVTAYNTGTYYAEKNGEKWKEFKELYDDVYKKEMVNYSKFPWIITEFASSSIGGDKVKWIENMFKHMKDYPNIKMAFWFNSADYDTDSGYQKNVSRPYWLDETKETTEAFKKGLKQGGLK